MNLELHKSGIPVIEEPSITIEIQKEFDLALSRLRAENPSARCSMLGDGRFKIDLPVITCTGANVTSYFQASAMHGLERMEIKHVDSSKADSSNALAYSLEHRHTPGLWLKIIDVDASTASDIYDEYKDMYMELGQYRIISNSTNTELLYISVTIKITGV